MRRVAAAVVASLALPLPADAAVPKRPCDSRAEGPGPVRRLAGPQDVRIGPVAFFGMRRLADPAEFARFRTPGPRYRVKTPIKVRAGRVVAVSVKRSVAGLTFAHRSGPRGAAAVRFSACDEHEPAFSYPGAVGPLTVFAGGFVLPRPACVKITVRVRGRRAPYRRTVPFGTGDCRRR